MSGRIQRLPRDVAERIAAGEVVERPVSVVRELLDNTLDAGARDVTVEVRGGGLELIRVADDGRGIPADEVELAFERYATSKIAAVEDLDSLGTLGFRGEALASIAAVAEVVLVTRTADSPVGTQATVRAGEILRRVPAARQPGTTVTVRHLFHNVPARLKFLAGARGESLLIGQLVRRYALAHPDVRFSFGQDGRPSFRSSGSGRVEAVLGEVYGPAVAASLLALPETHAAGATIRGFLSGHAVTRPGRHGVTLFTNGRWAASRGLLTALEAAYRPHLPRGRHPIAAIFLDVPASDVDANVHPAKTEVKLLHESVIAEALAGAVREVLARTPSSPSPAERFALDPLQYHLPTPRRRFAEDAAGWGTGDADTAAAGVALDRLRVVAQVQETLILAEGPGGLFLVDQHRAHERVLYERLRAEGPALGQGLLEPVVLELKPHQAALLGERLADLAALGFDCQRFGGRDYLVRAAPSLPGGEDVTSHLQALLETAAADDDAWQERLRAALACRAALRRNRPLDRPAMERLLRDLAATAAPAVCPHGSPLILLFSGRFLERQFNW